MNSDRGTTESELDQQLEYALNNPSEALEILKKLVPEYKKLN